MVMFIGLLLLGGIADGILDGASWITALWSLPILFAMWLSTKVSDRA